MTLRNFSGSVSCRDGVSTALEADEFRDPVGLDRRVSCGERQKPVTWMMMMCGGKYVLFSRLDAIRMFAV